MKANVILMLLVSVLIGGCSAHKDAHDRLFNHGGETNTKPDYCGGDHKKCKGGKLEKNTANELRKKLKDITQDKDPENQLTLILLVDSYGRMVTLHPEDTEIKLTDKAPNPDSKILGEGTTSIEITPFVGSHCLYVVYKLNMSGTGYQSYCMIPGKH